MRYTLTRTALPFITAATVLLAASGAGAAEAGDEPVPAAGTTIVMNDGTVAGVDDETGFAFAGDEPEPHDFRGPVCPEVNQPPEYTVKGKPYFLADKGKPQSTWLLPRQSVSWAVTGSHTFTFDVTGGYEAEAKIIVAKAKVKVDVKIGNSWTWTGSQTVSDTNSTNKGYRAVLGQVGWKLTSVKTWYAPPCTKKTKTIIVKAPRKGDMSIGRQSS
ncbi:hypothetical protein [Streptomyces acidiscabies]|uniref:Secreted protein n=1 Tax=Streptomyces acidiscabies TaxID=42234 RepID=A0AAP6BID8_9ACTN|nr:hypothetical protein [Streptomyces acidiscabies]MBZ3909730.1 hypothetical protein [Streptomyces acidiscabies]MDX2965308.1 hypothetical protein [Streptomyces acidiscabies]MDX3024623.1 hypothetical protein [Streptomyces acidiscabies]MDX3795142.1 hypothetical protein [Streptomyces acidiscabies]GAV42278.1 hypothetical protein Saa2_05207 [Streptomyces acidiscabies]